MPLRYVFDEHFRGRFLRAVRLHNRTNAYPIDVVAVGDPPDLPRGSRDLDVLVWAEKENRILVSRDRKTLIGDLTDHLSKGRPSPGVFVVRLRATVADVIEFLSVAAYASDPMDWKGSWWFIP
jgi:hypothetical protein